MARPTYLNISEHRFMMEDLINLKKTFTSSETTYTKKIKLGKETFLFNEEGKGDFNGLHLINLVRRDANNFLEKNKIKEPSSIRYFELTEKPPKTLISKVDIRAAYWSYAIQNGIVTKETDDFLNESYDSAEMLKKARLRALGSLATKKRITEYLDGEIFSIEVKDEKTRDLYLHINEGIDKVMMEMAYTIKGAFYYYWDCIFVGEEATSKVIKFIEQQKYNYTVKTTKIESVDVGEHKYLLSKSDEKMYLVKPDQKIFLQNLRDKELNL